MSFLSSYKKLDNLCKDIFSSDKGITTYIVEMENNNIARNKILGWENDYKKLKQYRYIRNQIVHDDYADEENMCSFEDTLWLDSFYQRIIDRKDPLAVLGQMMRERPVANNRPIRKVETYNHTYEYENKNVQSTLGCLKIFAIAMVATALAGLLYYFLA